MNKQFYKFFSTFLILCFALNVFGSLHAENKKALVVSLIGKARVQSAQSKKWRPLRVKSIVNDQDRIQTGKGSKLVIIYKGVQIRLNAETDIVIESLVQGGPAKVNLKKGFGWFSVQPGQKLQVGTPSALAGVRGTKFAVAANKSGTISCVCEGTVETAAKSKPGEKKAVEAGWSHSYAPNGELQVKDFRKYFRKLKLDRSFRALMKKDVKLQGCTRCHRMTNLATDKRPDEDEEWF